MIFAGPLAYVMIYAAAIIEGEVVFVAAAVMVSAGELQWWPVMVSGALGAATGDQLYFYALRGRVDGWLRRFRGVATRHEAIVARVKRHEVPMILALRFAPGLRIAIAAACAYACVRPVRFSVLNALAAFVWAAALLGLIAWGGPAALQHAGIHGLWSALIPGALVLVFSWWLCRSAAP